MAIAASIIAAYFNAFERFSAWARLHERMQVDELLVTALIFCVAFGYLIVRHDSDLKRYLLKAEADRAFAINSATTDELTGLPNRRAFRDHATALRAKGLRVHILILGLDGFKAVNDTWGHASGDEVLRCVGLRLGALLERLSGTHIARLGGDEFAVLVADNLCPKAPERVAEAIIETVTAALPGWANFHLSASIGISGDLDDAPLHELMQQADLAMYLAKRSGGGRYEHAPSSSKLCG